MYRVALKNATPQHANLLEKVYKIGHFPQRIVGGAFESASEDRRDENALRKIRDKVGSSMHKTCRTYLRALQDYTTQAAKRQKQKILVFEPLPLLRVGTMSSGNSIPASW